MRIATWNVNSVSARLPRLLAWLETSGTDVVCLQELKCSAEAFPADEVRALGYEALVNADGRWNGVAVLSRVGLDDTVLGLPEGPSYDGGEESRAPPGRRAEGCASGRSMCPTAARSATPTTPTSWSGSKRCAARAEREAPGEVPFAILGDYNIAPSDDDVYDRAAFEGSTHVTEPERAALTALRETGLSDVVPRPLKYDHPYTYWDYRQLCFPKNRGMRIDLVYGNAAFSAAVKDSYVDREERKGKGASDHAPVVVDLDV